MTIKWTNDALTEFRQAWNTGETVAVMEKRFGVGQQTIDNVRKDLGLPARASRFWTPERLEKARRLYIDEGKSASEVARALGNGATRNAIIGKAHRAGWILAARKAPSKPARLASPPKFKVPRNRPALVFGTIPRAANDSVKVQAPPPVSLASVESPNARPWMNRQPGECNWTIGDRGAIKSCCNPVSARGWCAGHFAVGTVPNLYKGQSRSASSYSRHDRIEKDRPLTPKPDRTAWDDARQVAA